MRIRHSRGEGHGLVKMSLLAAFKKKKAGDKDGPTDDHSDEDVPMTRFADADSPLLRHNADAAAFRLASRRAAAEVDELMEMRAQMFTGHAAGLPVVSGTWADGVVPYTFSKSVASRRQKGRRWRQSTVPRVQQGHSSHSQEDMRQVQVCVGRRIASLQRVCEFPSHTPILLRAVRRLTAVLQSPELDGILA